MRHIDVMRETDTMGEMTRLGLATRKRLASGGIAIALWLAGSGALAQGSAAAEVLFEQGRQALAAGDYETACSRFRESDRLDPAAGTKLNLALCEEKRGKIATAWELFRASIAQLPADDDRLPIAQQHVAALESRIPTLTLKLAHGAPRSTNVSDGKVELGAASFGVPLPRDPGRYALVVSAPGHASRTISISLSEKQALDVEVAPGAPIGAAASIQSPSSGANGTGDSGGHSDTRTLGYILGGAGAVGVLVGGVTTFILIGKRNTAEDHCDDRTRTCDQEGIDANDSGRALAPVSTIAWVLGAAGLGAGAYLILTSADDSETRLGGHLVSGGGGVSVITNW